MSPIHTTGKVCDVTFIRREVLTNIGIDLAHIKVCKYYNLSDDSPIYCAAIILHPALKVQYFEEK